MENGNHYFENRPTTRRQFIPNREVHLARGVERYSLLFGLWLIFTRGNLSGLNGIGGGMAIQNNYNIQQNINCESVRGEFTPIFSSNFLLSQDGSDFAGPTKNTGSYSQ